MKRSRVIKHRDDIKIKKKRVPGTRECICCRKERRKDSFDSPGYTKTCKFCVQRKAKLRSDPTWQALRKEAAASIKQCNAILEGGGRDIEYAIQSSGIGMYRSVCQEYRGTGFNIRMLTKYGLKRFIEKGRMAFEFVSNLKDSGIPNKKIMFELHDEFKRINPRLEHKDWAPYVKKMLL